MYSSRFDEDNIDRYNSFLLCISLVWCALGSATGGKHLSAISHSSIHPIENHKSGDRDRSSKESAPSRL